MNKRLTKIKKYMESTSLDSILITDRSNMRYLAGYTGEGYLVISKDRNCLVTDSRYTEQARIQTDGFEILDISTLKPCEAFGGLKATGFENISISYSRYTAFSKVFKKLEPINSVLLDMRAVKEEEEIKAIEKAEAIGDEAFAHILHFIKPGVSERDIALEIEFFMRKNGAEKLSFDVIAASGAHGAMPHAEPDTRLIKKGDFVVLDFGCVYNGYCGDMTRTVCVGKASAEMRKVYSTVLRAQEEALEMLKEGLPACDAHKRALDITDEFYKGAFGHALGHGVGLEVHEEPRLSVKNSKPLTKGNVVSVEPGIYLPGFCGVRIEDLVVIEDQKCRNLTHSDKKLIEL